jgi:hypothetical protein
MIKETLMATNADSESNQTNQKKIEESSHRKAAFNTPFGAGPGH